MTKYYFYLYFRHDFGRKPLFVVTPVEYFDRKGFLDDTRFHLKDVYWPSFLVRVVDSYYESQWPVNVTLDMLRGVSTFKELDMLQVIGLKYEKSREGGL